VLHAFEAWRAASARHAEAYEQVRTARARAASLASDPALLALRHEAVTRATLMRQPQHWKRRAIAAGVLLMAGGPLAAWGIEHWAPRPAAPRIEESFRTGVGQQSDVLLPDGSRVTLDTDSRLSVRYGDGERRLVLEGQGWFALKPSSQPVVISAGRRTLTADAGSFDVRADPGQVRMLAVDGQATVRATGGAAVTLEPGTLLSVQGSTVSTRRPRSLTAITGWRDGTIQFDDVRLADAVEELNRYRRQPIRVADPRAAGLRVSGSFRTAESPAFVDALATGFPVRVKRDSGEGPVIASR
jgi:transmembrane sensor